MSLYYLLLFFERFHDNPRFGATLFHAGFFPVTPVKVVGALAVVAALIGSRPGEAVARQRNVQPFLFFLCAALPMLTAITWGTGVPSEWLSDVLCFVMLLLATRLLICTEQRLYSTIRVLVLIYCVSCLWVFKQHFVQGEDRAYGLDLDANYEAMGLVMLIPLTIWVARHESRKGLKRLAYLGVPILIYSTLLTESRGGTLALSLLAVRGFYRSRHKVALVLAFLAMAPLVTLVLPAGYINRFANTSISGVPMNGDEQSSQIHFEVIRGGMEIMIAHPLFGVGIGDFVDQVVKFEPELLLMEGHMSLAHDTYLQVGTERGFPVLILWLGLMLSGFINLRRAERLARGQPLGDLALAIRFSLSAFSVAALFITAEWVIPYWLMIFLSQNLREIVGVKYAEAEETTPVLLAFPGIGELLNA